MKKGNVQRRLLSDVGFLIIFLLFLLEAIYISPFYEFAINDDWSYALSVKNFYEKGILNFIGAANSFFHTFWGWLFVLPLGFSFSALRISTIFIHLIGSLALYKVFREMNFTIVWSLFSVFLIIFNPWVFHLSYSFMSDVPYLSLLTIGLLFYYKGIFEKKSIYLWIGSMASSISFLIREIGILLPISVCIYLLLCERRFLREQLLCIVGIPLVVIGSFEYWYIFIHGVTESHKFHRNTMLHNLMNVHVVNQFFERSLIILYFLGLTLLPLSAWIGIPIKRILDLTLKKKILLGGLILIIIILGTGRFLKGDYSPIDRLWMSGSFLGVLEGAKPAMIPLKWVKILFLVLVLSSCIIFCWLYLIFETGWKDQKGTVFIVLLGFIQFIYLLIAPFFFQRYYLPLIPFVILGVSVSLKRRALMKNPGVFLFLIVPAFFSVVTTKDSMSWNQAKWSTAQTLVNKGITPKKIEAGIEWDCWNFYEYSKENRTERAKRYYPVPWWLIDLAPVVDPIYKLSFSELDGYELAARHSYHSPVFKDPQEILLLVKKPPKTIEGFEDPKRDFTTGWNHNLKGNTLQLNRNLNFVSEGASSLKCDLETNSMDIYHYGGVRVRAPMGAVGFIFDLWLMNPTDVKKVFVYCYGGNGNHTAKWVRDVSSVPIRRSEKNTFYFLFGLSQDGFEFVGGSGGETDYVDIFVESDKRKRIIFYIDNFRT